MSSDASLEKAFRDATKTCTTNQSMIELTSKHLEELRTQCSSTDKITHIEIREAEVSVASKHRRSFNKGERPGTTQCQNSALANNVELFTYLCVSCFS